MLCYNIIHMISSGKKIARLYFYFYFIVEVYFYFVSLPNFSHANIQLHQ